MLDRRLFVSEVDELLRTHGPRLQELRGRTIRATWVAWDQEDDEWLSDEAVILDVGSDQLEIVFWKLDEVALTWNSVNTSARPAWVAQWDEGRTLAWRQDALPALRSVVGKTITGISIVEYDRAQPANIGQAWILSGLEFNFGEERLQVYNALDENGVTTDPPIGPEFRRIEVV